jgi:PRC-barrel domain
LPDIVYAPGASFAARTRIADVHRGWSRACAPDRGRPAPGVLAGGPARHGRRAGCYERLPREQAHRPLRRQRQNERIGKIDDFVIGHDEGHSLFTVLEVGGFLGIGSRLVAVPYDSLTIDESGNKIELPGASKDQLKQLAEFRYGS